MITLAKASFSIFKSSFEAFSRWRERARLRREIAGMTLRDFGDIPVSPSVLREELRRWPWQDLCTAWGAIARDNTAPEANEGASDKPVIDSAPSPQPKRALSGLPATH